MNLKEQLDKRNAFYANNSQPQVFNMDRKAYEADLIELEQGVKASIEQTRQSIRNESDPSKLKEMQGAYVKPDLEKVEAKMADSFESRIAMRRLSQEQSQTQGESAYQRQFITRERLDESKRHEEQFDAFIREKGRVPVEGEMEKFTAKPTITKSEKPWEQKPKAQSM